MIFLNKLFAIRILYGMWLSKNTGKLYKQKMIQLNFSRITLIVIFICELISKTYDGFIIKLLFSTKNIFIWDTIN